MEQYILKSALAAEIESKRKYAQHLGDNAINSSMQQFYDGMKQCCVDILSFIDTLEVEESPTDAFIEKACEFFKERLSFDDSWHVEGEDCMLDKVIKDFKKYMQE